MPTRRFLSTGFLTFLILSSLIEVEGWLAWHKFPKTSRIGWPQCLFWLVTSPLLSPSLTSSLTLVLPRLKPGVTPITVIFQTLFWLKYYVTVTDLYLNSYVIKYKLYPNPCKRRIQAENPQLHAHFSRNYQMLQQNKDSQKKKPTTTFVYKDYTTATWDYFPNCLYPNPVAFYTINFISKLQQA